jgi:nucleoside 2-deoxyribosyltransferase
MSDTNRSRPRVYIGMPITFAGRDHTPLFQEVARRISVSGLLEPVLPSDADDTIRWSYAVGGDTPLDELCAALVERDLQRLQQSDGALFLLPEPSVGTAMEITYAHRAGIPSVVLVPLRLLYHPWLRYHSTVVLWAPDPLGPVLDHAAKLLAEIIRDLRHSEDTDTEPTQ